MNTYQEELQAYRQALDTDLREEDSWLALAGLYWLKEGENTFGAGDTNAIVLPTPSMPGIIGCFTLDGEKITLQVTGDVIVKVNGEDVREAVLLPDTSKTPDRVHIGDLTIMIIQRDDTYGIRLWDNGRLQRQTTPTRQWYPFHEAYRLKAEYDPSRAENLITMQSINTGDLTAPAAGTVHFTLFGEDCHLIAFAGAGDALFLMFNDRTNGRETYAAGRYLEAGPPQRDRIIVDFNRAFNPPCAFTKYATCPLPPEQNRLQLPIRAGEKKPQTRQ